MRSSAGNGEPPWVRTSRSRPARGFTPTSFSWTARADSPTSAPFSSGWAGWESCGGDRAGDRSRSAGAWASGPRRASISMTRSGATTWGSAGYSRSGRGRGRGGGGGGPAMRTALPAWVGALAVATAACIGPYPGVGEKLDVVSQVVGTTYVALDGGTTRLLIVGALDGGSSAPFTRIDEQ